MNQLMPSQAPVVHLRFEGRSWDIEFNILDVGDQSSDLDIRQALANYFNVPIRKFSAYVVQRHENGNITVRPEAVFG